PMALRASGVTAVDVMNTLASQNLMTPGGNLDAGPDSLTLRVDGRVDSVEAIGNLIVRSRGGSVLRLSDVARIVDGQQATETLARYDGEQAVVLSIVKQSGENTIEVVDRVLSRVALIQETLPEGVELSVV